MDLSRALGWLPPDRYQTSPMAKPAALGLWHRPEYITALMAAEVEGAVTAEVRNRFQIGTLSNPVFAQMYRRPATGAGGVMWAAERLSARAGVIHVPGGGTHHGMPDRANGFCYLNDVVLGIKLMQARGLQRIAYVDIDAHHCDGVEAGCGGDPDVLMISVHEEGRWPFTGRLVDDAGGNAFNLPVPAGFNDSEMRMVLEDLILPRVAAHRPDAIILQCGADAVLEDPLSRLALSNNAHVGVALALRDICSRFLVLGGGGYNPWSVGRCWAAVWGSLSGQEVPDHLPDVAQDVLRGLSWGGGGRPLPAESLFTTLLDLPRDGAVRPDIRERLAFLAQR